MSRYLAKDVTASIIDEIARLDLKSLVLGLRLRFKHLYLAHYPVMLQDHMNSATSV